jgi:hypothetical protein
MLKSIVFEPGAAFESIIAWRSEPVPESFVFTTTNVVGIIRRSRSWKSGRYGCGFFLFLSWRRLNLRRG